MGRARQRWSKPDAPPATGAPHDTFWTPPLIALIVVGTALRMWYINQPMRYDEAVTYLYFAGKPWATAIGSYAYPNNHVFHTALVKVCASVFGNSPASLRLPAFAAGVALIPVTFAAGRRIVGVGAAYFGAAIVAASGVLTLFSTNSRGYTIICLATVVLLLLLHRLRDEPTRADWIGVAVTAALGLWTVPVMLYPAGGLALWFAIACLRGESKNGRGDLRPLALAVLATAAITALLYSPIIAHDGVGALVHNRFVEPTSGHTFLSDLSATIAPLVALMTLGLPPAAVAVFVALLVMGLAPLRDETPPHVSLALPMVAWCALLLLATHHAPFARVWLFLVPPAALIAGRGATRMLSRVPPTSAMTPRGLGLAAVVASLMLSAAVIASHNVERSRDTGTLPDAAAIAHLLAPLMQPGDHVIAPIPSTAPLQYEFLRAGLDTAYLAITRTIARTPYLIINTGEGFTVESTVSAQLATTYPVAQLLGTFAGAEVYRLQKTP